MNPITRGWCLLKLHKNKRSFPANDFLLGFSNASLIILSNHFLNGTDFLWGPDGGYQWGTDRGTDGEYPGVTV